MTVLTLLAIGVLHTAVAIALGRHEGDRRPVAVRRGSDNGSEGVRG